MFFRTIAAVATFVATTAGAAQARDVGDVTELLAKADAISGTEVRALQVRSDLFDGELIRTGDDARMHAEFADGTILMLGENATLQLDAFVYGTDRAPNGVINLTEGAFRLISGAINKEDGGSLTLHTPVATIGIRGTDFWGYQTEDQIILALIDDGELDVTVGGESFTMTDPMTVVTLRRGEAPGEVQELSEDALAEAAETVLLPN